MGPNGNGIGTNHGRRHNYQSGSDTIHGYCQVVRAL
jgi:hypothetical protein